MKLTIKQAKRICREYGMTRKNVSRMKLREAMSLDAVLVLINSTIRARKVAA